MCIFASAAEVVQTDMFATSHGGRQVLVCGVTFKTPEPNAMLVPIPVVPRSMSNGFQSHADHRSLFDDLQKTYAPQLDKGWGASSPSLDVSTADCSERMIVPSLDEIGRPDGSFGFPRPPRFTISRELRSVLAERYGDWAFIIYLFAAGSYRVSLSSITFESRYPEYLFFPTVQVHDGGKAPPTARFDHLFYAQGAKLEQRYQAASRSSGPPVDSFGRPLRASALFEREKPLDVGARRGVFANVDVFAKLDA